MKFALLGDDPDVLPLVRAMADHAEHQLIVAAGCDAIQADVLSMASSVRMVAGWEDLLVAACDVVIVCGRGEAIGESAKQLASGGQTLAFLPRGQWDTELIYELSLIRDDNGVALIPLVILHHHPVFGDFRAMDGAESDISHLRIEREIAAADAVTFTERELRRELLSDVALLRGLGGDYHQVTAVQSQTPDGGLVMATVTLTGTDLPDAVWTLRPADARNWELTIAQSEGSSKFRSNGGPEFISRVDAETPSFEAGQTLLDVIETARRDPLAVPDWGDLTRDFEVLDAVRRSLARRRTIDLHFETTSERSLFKTQMTAMGCGVFLLTIFAVIALLLLGSALDNRGPEELAADNAETIFYAEEFEPKDVKLTEQGQAHWKRVAPRRRDREMTPILVEQTDNAELSRRRASHLTETLSQEGVANADQRVVAMALDGPWFESVMRVARILVFVPLGVFLAVQTLLIITKPAQTREKSEKSV